MRSTGEVFHASCATSGISSRLSTGFLRLQVPLHHQLRGKLLFSHQHLLCVTSRVKAPLSLPGGLNRSLRPRLRQMGKLRSGKLSTLSKTTHKERGGEWVSLCRSGVLRDEMTPGRGAQADAGSQPSRRETESSGKEWPCQRIG